MQRIRNRLAAIHGTEAVNQEGRRLLTCYLEVIFKPKLQTRPSRHGARELATPASAMDALLRSHTARAGDIMIGSLKALEEAAHEGTWAIAQEYEVVHREEEGLVGHDERYRAASPQLHASKLRLYLDAANDRDRGVRG